MWPSMFWRFSLPMTTMCCPVGSATTAAGRSAPLVWWSPHCVASRLTMATPSARAWSSAEVGEMKWTWQSTAIQSAPAGPATGSSGRTSGARPTSPSIVERPGERAIAEPADDLDLHRAVRQLDGEPAGDVGVGRAAEDQVRAGVLVEARVDLVAMPERREVPPVGGPEPDPGRHRPRRSSHRRSRPRPGASASEAIRWSRRRTACGRRRPAGGPPARDPRRRRSWRRRSSRGRRASRSLARRRRAASPSHATALDCPAGRLEGRRRRALPEHLPEVHGDGTWRAAPHPRSAASAAARGPAARRSRGTP